MSSLKKEVTAISLLKIKEKLNGKRNIIRVGVYKKIYIIEKWERKIKSKNKIKIKEIMKGKEKLKSRKKNN